MIYKLEWVKNILCKTKMMGFHKDKTLLLGKKLSTNSLHLLTLEMDDLATTVISEFSLHCLGKKKSF